MNVDQLRMFLMVAELGSFQKAAQQGYVSQRAVSKQMQRLENEVGTPLFTRNKNRIQLTAAGELFQKRCQTILQLINETSSDLHSLAARTAPQLHIGYFSPFDAVLLRAGLQKLTAPVTPLTTEESVEHLITDVLIGNLDCAFIMDDYGFNQQLAQTGLKATIVDEDQMLIGAHKDLFPTDQVTPEQISHHPVIYYSNEESNYLQRAFVLSLGKLGRLISIHRVFSYEQMQMQVSLGQALSFYPANLVSYLANPSEPIRYLPIAGANTQHFTFKLIYLPTNQSPALKEFVQAAQMIMPAK